MKKVLILGVAAVQLDAIVALKESGYEVHACAMAKDGKGWSSADHFVEINFADIDAVETYVKKARIDAVYSVGSDLAMPVSTTVSERLGLPHFVSSETARICNHKKLLRQTLGQNFKGNISYQILTSVDDSIALPFPFIMKPADAQGQRGVRLVHTMEAFRTQFEQSKSYSRSGQVIIEKYISGVELSVNGYLVDGKLMFCLASDRETWPQFTGLIHRHIVPSSYSSETFDAKIFDLMERACKKLNIQNGPVYGQFKLEGNEPYIIEITPRFDGCHMWKLLEYSTGVDLLDIALRHLLENKIDIDTLAIKYGISPHVLEFICQAPGEKADYKDYERALSTAKDSFTYYESGDTIRPVNGQFEKIAYFINQAI